MAEGGGEAGAEPEGGGKRGAGGAKGEPEAEEDEPLGPGKKSEAEGEAEAEGATTGGPGEPGEPGEVGESEGDATPAGMAMRMSTTSISLYIFPLSQHFYPRSSLECYGRGSE